MKHSIIFADTSGPLEQPEISRAGANPKVLQVAMGHSDIRLTLDTYGGLFGDDLDSLADSMNAAVQGAGSETNVVKMLSLDESIPVLG